MWLKKAIFAEKTKYKYIEYFLVFNKYITNYQYFK